MRILVTNNTLVPRGGTESVVGDLARVLQGRGHTVLAYSSDERQRERLLENDQIPVASDLANLPFRPDLIHGFHHLDVMSALAALPGVPALYQSHGSIRRDYAPRHPRLYRYLASSRTRVERMRAGSAIPEGDFTVFPAIVDLARFRVVRQLPEQLKRGLFFNHPEAVSSALASAVSEAASRCGFDICFLDRHYDGHIDSAEALFPEFDLVFASGPSAVEALLCGCAVVVCGDGFCGELVHPENLERLRENEFAVPEDAPPPTAEQIVNEVGCYAVAASEAVSDCMRQAADIRSAVGDLLKIYEETIEIHQAGTASLADEGPAIARYLQEFMPRITQTERALGRNWISSTRPTTFEELSSRLGAIEHRLDIAPFGTNPRGSS
ncbi:MAG: hypothetical protein AAF591_19415 [Verrucomicrobiota bacterium]